MAVFSKDLFKDNGKKNDGYYVSVEDAVHFSASYANLIANTLKAVAQFTGPSGRKMTFSSETLPYYFAALMETKLQKSIPGSRVTANTYKYQIKEVKAVWTSLFRDFFKKLGF